MKERPILFSGPMVRAILDGAKTQTRRVVKPQPTNARTTYDDGIWAEDKPRESVTRYFGCPYGQPGDRLWVRETFNYCGGKRYYRADGPMDKGWKWKPSIFMPRWASRITLEIVSVRVERLQDITEEDAKAEGVTPHPPSIFDGRVYRRPFNILWDSINGKPKPRWYNPSGAQGPGLPKKARITPKPSYPWPSNPWVWVITFKRL